MDAHFLIAHWGYLTHARILYLLETFDMLCWSIVSWLRILIPWFLLCFIDIFDRDIDMLDYWWLILLLCLALWPWFFSWLFWSLHMHTLTTVHHSTRHADPLVGILFWSSLSMLSLYHYPSNRRILAYLVCVHWWYIWDLFDCLSHDCLSAAWLHDACLCGSHIYPLTSTPLVFGHFLHFGSHFCKCEALCVLDSLSKPDVRSRV